MRTPSPEEYLALRSAVGWPTMSPAVAEAALSASLAVATVRDDEGGLVGIARAVGDGFYVVIVDVMVLPSEQEQGLAQDLLTDLLADPRVDRAGHVSLFAAPDALELYESFGFRAEGGTHMERA